MRRGPSAQPIRLSAAQRQAATRVVMIDSAVEVFSEQGYHRASLDEISRRAGFSTGAVYSNFSGKEGLFFACLDRRAADQAKQWESFFSRIEDRGYDHADLTAVLHAVIPDRSWRRAVVEFTVVPKSSESTGRLIDAQRGWRAVVRRMVIAMISNTTTDRLVASSSTGHDTAPISVDDGAEIIAAVVDGLMIAGQVDPELAIEDLAATTIRLITGQLTSTKGPSDQ